MPIPDDFHEECLYSKEAWFISDVLEMDRENLRLVCEVDTTNLGPIVDAQRTFPGHDKHLPGAVAVQLTGTLAGILAAYCMDMRPSQGWVGFGTHIHHAKFPTMGIIGPPVQAAVDVLKRRHFRGTTFVRYRYEYTQEDRTVYLAEHSAAWFQSEHRGPLGDH